MPAERTAAKIGRVMKKDESFTAHRPVVARRLGLHLRRPSALTCMPGRTRCRPLTTTSSPAGEPLADDAQAVDERPERDRARFDLPVGADHQHEAAVEIGADGAVLDQHAGYVAVPGRRRRTNSPGVRRWSGLRKTARPRIVPVDGIELVVEELQRALVRERRFVGERHADRQAALAGARLCAHAVAVAQERLLVGVERRRRSDRPTPRWSAAWPRPGRPRPDCRG